ncbi:MAG: NAD-dependent succinate-semialdehyde dehydrogenase [Pseudomonadota bacterium]
MPYSTCNPLSNETLQTFTSLAPEELNALLARASEAQKQWRNTDPEERAQLATRLADLTRERQNELAALATLEMGKPIKEALAEIEKCALGCDYYSVHAAPFLAEEPYYTDAGKSYVSYTPIGVVLAVMPWNFPFWQVFRAAVPAILAGNTVVLKHASNVPQVAAAIEQLFRDAGFPEHVFTNAFAESKLIDQTIASPHVQAVTLTGSARAGRSVAAQAGAQLKKCVLELGGSDPFIVLADADLELAATQAVIGRFQNCGQSCIASKRFILVPEIADEFIALFKEKVAALKIGDPTREDTQIGPMARPDLRDELHAQVQASIAAGATAVLGCVPLPGNGNFYAPSILDNVTPAAPAYREELFGPVAIILRAKNEEDALRLANDTPYGLGASLWSRDFEGAEDLGMQIEAGMIFVNGIVKSDPRLPFGGIKDSGFGRELSYHGIREFVNAKTVWVRDRAAHLGEERRQAERRQMARRN